MWTVGPSMPGLSWPLGPEWYFESPVGVDCSKPEPRCIWLAVLRGVTSTLPSEAQTKSIIWQTPGDHSRAKGQRDEISSSNHNARPISGEGVAWQGPRTVVLHKNSQGFGFTLRHFIVYPPESALHTSLKDEENGNEKGIQRSRLEPMDTIFVKNVRERGPAHQAGLCTGDRLVKVNGESVLGKTYSEVIALIQNSDSALELSIMPKDEDVLQLAFSHDAYLKGNEPYKGGAQSLPEPPTVCYPRSMTKQQPQQHQTPVSQPLPPATTGHNQLDNRSSRPGSSPLDNRSGMRSPVGWREERLRGRSYSSGSGLVSPLHFHFANHNAAIVQASQPRGLPSRDARQQALCDWYYSQAAMPPRHRSYSQDQLAEDPQSWGWPHSASHDTLLLHSAPTCQPTSRTRSENQLCSYARRGRSLEMLDMAPTLLSSPRSEKHSWLQKAPPVSHTERQGNIGVPIVPAIRTSQPRRLPQHAAEGQQQGYRSYSPSFYRKAGRIMQAHSFRDPGYSGPQFTWTPTPKTSPPEAEAPKLPEEVEVVKQQAPTVVLRQKPPMGRRPPHALRHPHYALPVDSPGARGLPADLCHKCLASGEAPRCTNGGLPPLCTEDDSLASIPYIDEPTSPSADLLARHVPASSVVSSTMSPAPATTTSPVSPTFTFPLTKLISHDCKGNDESNRLSSYMQSIPTERSKSCDEGLNTFREEGHIFMRLPKRVKSFFGDGSLDSLGAAEDARAKRHSTSELGSITFSEVRREGWLHYKQILTEKGKKVGSGMRPWKRVFCVLRSHSLFLYKDKREAVLHGTAATAGTGHGEDEQPISIRGCLVDIAYSETKRKHTLRLTTQDFCEYLLQAENRDDMLGWIRVIRDNSKTDNEELGFSRQALINKKLNEYRKHSPTGTKPDTSPKLPRMKPPFLPKMDNVVGAPRSPKSDGKDESSPPKSPWPIGLIKKVKKSAPKAFGARLEDCQPAASNKFVPLIVEFCCGLVESMGLEYTGVYRVPGNNAMVSNLQEQLNKGCDINTTDEKWQDLNVISSLLKSFFRKLPEPLFTDDKYGDFIDANRMENATDRLKTLRKLIHDLPEHYYHTLKFLIGHLKRVADHSDRNKMEPRNLALVFGPTLVRTSDDNMTEMVTHMPDRYKIVETLIQHNDWFFSEQLDKDEKTPEDKEDHQPIPNIDHLLSNIGRTAGLGEASDSTNSDSAKSKGSWGSKRDLTAKDFTLSLLSAVTRKRKKRSNLRLLGSSTDEDSEHEPVKASNRGGRGNEKGEMGDRSDVAPRAEGEDDEEEEEEEEEEEGQRKKEEAGGAAALQEAGSAVVGATEDARSIVSGYSTLSTLGHSLTSEGHGDEADDERSELVSETDNESGFASRSLTQERPGKTPQVVHSFPYTQYRPHPLPPPPATRSVTPSSSSSSSTTHRPHSRPSFSSHKLIQCDTLARKKLKGDKTKMRSLDLETGLKGSGVVSEPRGSRLFLSTSQKELRPASSEASSFSPTGSLAEHVRTRLLGSTGDLPGVGLRKPASPETRRKKNARRRHTVVVNLSSLHTDASSAQAEVEAAQPAQRSTFHQYL